MTAGSRKPSDFTARKRPSDLAFRSDGERPRSVGTCRISISVPSLARRAFNATPLTMTVLPTYRCGSAWSWLNGTLSSTWESTSAGTKRSSSSLPVWCADFAQPVRSDPIPATINNRMRIRISFIDLFNHITGGEPTASGRLPAHWRRQSGGEGLHLVGGCRLAWYGYRLDVGDEPSGLCAVLELCMARRRPPRQRLGRELGVSGPAHLFSLVSDPSNQPNQPANRSTGLPGSLKH